LQKKKLTINRAIIVIAALLVISLSINAVLLVQDQSRYRKALTLVSGNLVDISMCLDRLANKTADEIPIDDPDVVLLQTACTQLDTYLWTVIGGGGGYSFSWKTAEPITRIVNGFVSTINGRVIDKTLPEAAGELHEQTLSILAALSKDGRVHYDDAGVPKIAPDYSLRKERIGEVLLEAYLA
jgi:hypothetical protein